MGFIQGTQERVRNGRGQRAISVRATEVLEPRSGNKFVILRKHRQLLQLLLMGHHKLRQIFNRGLILTDAKAVLLVDDNIFFLLYVILNSIRELEEANRT